jgi:hypothetical protein
MLRNRPRSGCGTPGSDGDRALSQAHNHRYCAPAKRPSSAPNEWNTAAHVQDNEGRPAKRAFTVEELQAFFDFADEQAVKVSSLRDGLRPHLTEPVRQDTG